jgi:acetolactate synthase I/II/III large subunit
MRRAFSQVKNGRQGPVMVEVPADVVGTEVGVDPGEYRPVRERLAELLQAPVMTTFDGKSAFPEDHALLPCLVKLQPTPNTRSDLCRK